MPDPGESKLRTRVTRCRSGPGVDQSQKIQVKSRWGPESPDPGEAQVGTKSIGPDEAQVRTRVTRYM